MAAEGALLPVEAGRGEPKPRRLLLNVRGFFPPPPPSPKKGLPPAGRVRPAAPGAGVI